MGVERHHASPPHGERGSAESAYEPYRRGMQLLESRRAAEAIPHLERAKGLAAGKSSIEEALGRAYWTAGLFAAAEAEFREIVDRHAVDHYAHFCLARSLQKLGRPGDARRHFAIAASLRPDRADYRRYRVIVERGPGATAAS